MNSAIFQHLQRVVSVYRPQDRAIVFCRSKEHVTELAGLFNTHPYYAAGDDENLLKRNKEAMMKWVSGENQVLTSTSVLGCGMDYSHIRDVVHRDPSFTMLDQYQEDSRGGRDGLECRATTFIVEKKRYPLPRQAYDLGSKILVDSLNDTTQCLRLAQGLYLDGQATQCVTLPGAHLCYNCERLGGSGLFSSNNDSSLSLPVPKQAVVSSVPKRFSPPKRSFDLFDQSPLIDLRDHTRPLKRKRSSIASTISAISPSAELSSTTKKVHFSDVNDQTR